MMKIRKQILEIKILGINFYIPFLVAILLSLYSFLLRNSEMRVYYYIDTYQLLIPIFCSWWVIFNLVDLVEENGGDILLTYCKSTTIGILNCFKYIFLYYILFITTIVINFYFLGIAINYNFLILIFFQCLYYGVLSFFGMCLLRNSSWTIFLVFTLFCIVFFIGDLIVPFLNIYSKIRAFPDSDKLMELIPKIMFLSFIYSIVGHYFLNNRYKFFKMR